MSRLNSSPAAPEGRSPGSEVSNNADEHEHSPMDTPEQLSRVDKVVPACASPFGTKRSQVPLLSPPTSEWPSQKHIDLVESVASWSSTAAMPHALQRSTAGLDCAVRDGLDRDPRWRRRSISRSSFAADRRAEYPPLPGTLTPPTTSDRGRFQLYQRPTSALCLGIWSTGPIRPERGGARLRKQDWQRKMAQKRLETTRELGVDCRSGGLS